MKRNRPKAKRGKREPDNERQGENLRQVAITDYAKRRFELHERICEAIGAITTVLIAVNWYFQNSSGFIWSSLITVCAGILAFCFWFADHKSGPAPETNVLDKSASPALTPASTPSADSLTLAEIMDRLKDAEKHGRREEVLKSLDGKQVDWIMRFATAIRDKSNATIRVGFTDMDSKYLLIVIAVLPAEGNERWLTTGTLDVFRVRGDIDAATSGDIRLLLRNARPEYVRTDPDDSSSRFKQPLQTQITLPAPTTEPVLPAATPSNMPLDSSTLDLTPKQVSDRILQAPDRDSALNALAGLSVDWTLLLERAKSADSEHFLVTFRDCETTEGDMMGGIMISCTIPIKGHERLPLVSKGTRFNVKGTITPWGAFDWMLQNVSIKLLS